MIIFLKHFFFKHFVLGTWLGSSIFTWLSNVLYAPNAIIYHYSVKLDDCRKIKGFRRTIFRLAEMHCGKCRVKVDGIQIEGNSLHVSLVFGQEFQAEQFQSSLINFVENTGFRKRKREDRSILGAIVAIRSYSTSLQRVFESDYSHDPDIEGTENSPPDNISELESSMITSTEAVELTYEVRLQMIEKTDTILLLNQTPEKCHLHSSKILEHKNNRNNWIYLSRAMHHQFDGIDTPFKNCPSFVIHYVSHDSSFVDCLINDRGDIQARHRTVVHVYFRTREFFNAFVVYLKDGGQQVAPSTYQMDLFFLDGEQAKFHLDHKEAETRRIWTEKCLTLV